MGAAPVRNREINMASLLNSLHMNGKVGFGDAVMQYAEKEESTRRINIFHFLPFSLSTLFPVFQILINVLVIGNETYK